MIDGHDGICATVQDWTKIPTLETRCPTASVLSRRQRCSLLLTQRPDLSAALAGATAAVIRVEMPNRYGLQSTFIPVLRA